MTPTGNNLQLLIPGVAIKNDWVHFPIPVNMRVGKNTVIDSSSCFKKFFSALPDGLNLGNNITIQSSELATEINGYIEIGDYCNIMGTTIIAHEKISIGSYVYIGFGTTIVDTDFHPLDPGKRMTDTIAISPAGNKSQRPEFSSSPVVIEDDVWIGFNVTILKGVTIGKGAVIQPGSVVTKNVSAGSVVSGNPAQLLSND